MQMTEMNPIAPDQVLATITSIPSLPALVTALMADLQDDEVNLHALAHKIASDSALTARLLQLANSSFYGLPRQVVSTADAVNMLGLRNVRSVVVAAAVMGQLPLNAQSAITFDTYWRHGVGTALCAQAIARQLGLDADNAYFAGLLHDIGRLVLASRFSESYQATVAHHRQHGMPMVQAEQFKLGLDHTTVGAALATHWKFPESIRLAIAEHHDCDRPGLDPIVMVVQLANHMSLALAHAGNVEERLRAVPCAAWQRLHLTEDGLHAAFAQAEEALALAEDILS